MSVPPPPQGHSRSSSNGVVMEDCRDYLRTGRCKYGASCKYNHPANVQSGGGMKAPLDPTVPMFPIRPSEPICQYYMKHGTCKFGQSCKFHHPPPASMPSVAMGGSTMNARRSDAPLVLNPIGADPNNSGSMMMQFLPQRPEEPDCIFFLKNGRCKYGATCRYHHPVNNMQQRRVDDASRFQQQQRLAHGQQQQKVQYIIPHSGFPQGQVVVSDSPVTIMSLDGSSMPQQGYQILTSSDGARYCVPVGTSVATEQGSAASSLTSSYDTPVPSHPDQFDVPMASWNRVKSYGSVSSLPSSYADSSNHGRSQQIRSELHPSGSDGSLQRSRGSSGSIGDLGLPYYDTSQGMGRSAATGPRPMTYEQSRFLSSNQPSELSRELSRDSQSPWSTGRPPPSSVGPRPPAAGGRQRRTQGSGGGNEDSFGKMLPSGLLNILDTPDEAAEYYRQEAKPPPFSYSQDELGQALFEGLSLDPSQHNGVAGTGALSRPPGMEGNQERHVLSSGSLSQEGGESRPRTASQPPNSPGGSDIGLYLP